MNCLKPHKETASAGEYDIAAGDDLWKTPNRDWCGRRDSNPHGLPHGILSPARLPVPPRPRGRSSGFRTRRRGGQGRFSEFFRLRCARRADEVPASRWTTTLAATPVLFRLLACGFLGGLFLPGCGGNSHRPDRKNPASFGNKTEEVVLFTAYAEDYVRPLLEPFEKSMGIKVRVISEKGRDGRQRLDLVARLILRRKRGGEKKKAGGAEAREGNAEADVYWGDEPTRAILLKLYGAAAPYRSAAARDVPRAFRDPDGYWTGFAARVYATVYDETRLPPNKEPRSWKQWSKLPRTAMSRPTAGSAVAFAAFLFAARGPEKARRFFYEAAESGCLFCPDEKTLLRAMMLEDLYAALLDGDDLRAALEADATLTRARTEAGPDGLLLIPDVAVLIADGPNEIGGHRLIDWLTGRELEKVRRKLAAAAVKNGNKHPTTPRISLHTGAEFSLPRRIKRRLVEERFSLDRVKLTPVDWEAAAKVREEAVRFFANEVRF